ncbi:unnamed protein product [Lymnaea stagnalis]|uniref:Uncharacterized protein n=1 Tax=Lymnaea stagnalis TaxID=6523 RepID=A0AAV2HUZ1_LYMST
MMSVKSYSSSTSSMSSTSSYLPKCRIRCSTNDIVVGDQNFQSATAALQVYLQQFEQLSKDDNKNIGTNLSIELFLNGGVQSSSLREHQLQTSDKKFPSQKCLNGLRSSGLLLTASGITIQGEDDDVEKLLTSKSNHHTAKKQEEITDALKEIKIKQLLKEATRKSQNQVKTGLQEEVEAALIRSAKLLEKVTRGEPATHTGSCASSVATDILLLDSATNSSNVEEKPTGHIYSYHTPRPQGHTFAHSLHVSGSQISHDQSRGRRKQLINHTSIPVSHQLPPQGKRSISSSSVQSTRGLKSSDILQQFRSRSLSPGVKRNDFSPFVADMTEQLNSVGRTFVPSWIGEENVSEISDSLWTLKTPEEVTTDRAKKVPSWIREVDGSDGSETDLVINSASEISSSGAGQHRTNGNAGNMTGDSRPGLHFSDLVTSSLNTPKNYRLTSEGNIKSTKRLPLHHSTPLHPKHKSPLIKRSENRPILDGECDTRGVFHTGNLSSTDKMTESIDQLLVSSSSQPVSSSSSDAGSSLDTLALLTGKTQPRAALTNISTIYSDLGSRSVYTSPGPSALNGAVRPGHRQSQESLDGMDGDRPWETLTNSFKPPVQVENMDSAFSQPGHDASTTKNVEGTLSGRKQPGSMEALKHMLFKLQAEEKTTQEASNQSQTDSSITSQDKMALIPGLQDYDFKQEPGGQSLEKALVHLNRLKELVKSTSTGTT